MRRKSVQPGLASSLTARNHLLEDLFVSKTLKMKQKKKKDKEEAEPTPAGTGEVVDDILDDDGCQFVEKVGVS